MTDKVNSKKTTSVKVQNSHHKENQKSSQDKKLRIYPELIIPYNKKPNRWFAFPFIGFIVKVLLILPIAVLLIFIEILYGVLMVITPFVILFTGRYWDFAYKYTLVYIRIFTKINLYIFGLTDTYPGFSFDENGIFTLRIDKPIKPSKFLAFPLLGYLIRILLLIPFIIYADILRTGAFTAVLFGWFAVLITGRYPESLYEFIKDYLRVWNAIAIYSSYISDTYPSFHISLNHKTIKIILLTIGAILTIVYYSFTFSNDLQAMKHQPDYSNTQSTSTNSNY